MHKQQSKVIQLKTLFFFSLHHHFHNSYVPIEQAHTLLENTREPPDAINALYTKISIFPPNALNYLFSFSFLKLIHPKHIGTTQQIKKIQTIWDKR